MAIVEWKDTYSVGVDSLDDQHKGLLEQLNILHDAMTNGKAQESLTEILDTLLKYTTSHFQAEEELFLKHGYSRAEGHIAEHNYFIGEIARHKEHNESGRSMVCFEVLVLLKTWLLKHILGSDMEYSELLSSKGVK